MRVRLTSDRATAYGYQPAGVQLELPRDEALALLKAGQAVPAEERRGKENAMREPRSEKRG